MKLPYSIPSDTTTDHPAYLLAQPWTLSARRWLLPVLCGLALSTPLCAELRVLSAWQNFEVYAGVGDGSEGSWHEKTASAGVPGASGSLAVAASVGSAETFTSASAQVDQQAMLLPDGFQVSGHMSATQQGILPQPICSGELIVEVEVTESSETLTLTTTHLVFENNGHADAFSAGLALGILYPDGDGWSGGWGSIGGTEGQITLSPGRYRLSVLTQINQKYNLDGTQNIDYSLNLTFSNFTPQPGSAQTNPLLPGPNFGFNDAPSLRWFAAPLATGYTFTSLVGPVIKEIVSLPGVSGRPYEILVGGIKVGEAKGGESFNFERELGSPVAEFKIRNVAPSEFATAGHFPVMLRFTEESASFQITPNTDPFVVLAPSENGDLKIHFSGILESSPDLSPESWEEVAPRPVCPLVIPRASLGSRGFFRARHDAIQP